VRQPRLNQNAEGADETLRVREGISENKVLAILVVVLVLGWFGNFADEDDGEQDAVVRPPAPPWAITAVCRASPARPVFCS
jgi:hypothetical protein